MEDRSSRTEGMPGGASRGLIPVLAPILLVSVGYIDPGKWASSIDTGARFGVDLVAFALVFNLIAVFCHYLAGRISVICGKNLAQVCSEEYDKLTCFFLGMQAELSVITLDLTMILGIAHGLNSIFGLDLFTCILLTTLNVVIYPLFSTLLESFKVKFLVVCLAGITFACYVFGMLFSLPEFPVPSNGLLSKLSGESAFALMSLLGASVMPHNFYLHSSVVQRYQVPAIGIKGSKSQDNFIISIVISSGIVLVNYVLMNSAANVFYSTGLGMLTFQDTMSLLDQAYKNPIIPFASFVILFLANQIMALSWEFCGKGGESILHDFFKMDLPEWLHRATIRIFSVVPALFCLWQSGAEGMYHMLICTQVMVALLLPSSVIPLFRIASSRPIMGQNKISPVLEFVALLTFMGILGLEIIFIVEMIFGESDWVGNLRWSMGNTSTSMAYVFLLVSACVSLGFMLWLAATPLKSVTSQLDSQAWNWDSQPVATEPFIEMERNIVTENNFLKEEPLSKPESLSFHEKPLRSHHPDMETPNHDVNLPETIMDTDQELRAVPIEETLVENPTPLSSQSHPYPDEQSDESVPTIGVVSGGPSGDSLIESSPMKTEPAEKTLRVEGDIGTEKDDEGDSWESKDVPAVGRPITPEGPGSFRSLSGKNDEGGASAGSLSRLSGLGRAARRQLAAALDEFWGQLYDFHGQMTQEAKSKKIDKLLGLNSSKPFPSLTNSESTGKDYGMQFQSLGGRVSENPINMNLYDSPNQQKLQQSIESAFRVNKGSGQLWSNAQMQLLDSYMQGSSRSMHDTGERRYQSLRLPPSSENMEFQPATVHGYQLASYLNRVAKETPDYLDPTLQKSPSLVSSNYRDSVAFALGQKSTNGFNSVQNSSIQNLALQRNSTLQSDKYGYDLSGSAPFDGNNTKKYHSLPSISGLSVPLRNLYTSDRSTRLDSPNPPLGFGTSVGRASYEPSSFSSSGSRHVGPLAFDELSPSGAYRDAIALRLSSGTDACSLWSKQPFEHFGVANKISNLGSQTVGTRSSMTIPQEPPSIAEVESKLLQSLRLCILKLLKLEGAEWLFRSNEGVDEDLIDRVAMRERFFYEAETRDLYSERKPGLGDDTMSSNVISSVPQCGEGCVFKIDLVISFGVWCIRRILELSLMESRPELWGKYTYVLNRLQGIIDVGFFKPRTPLSPCFCLQLPASYQTRSSLPVSNGMLPPTSRSMSKGKVTNAAMLLDIIKDVEIAISCRKGRSGTAAGDVAFPKGKENLASVLKRYKRRLSNKPVGSTFESGPPSRKLSSSPSYAS